MGNILICKVLWENTCSGDQGFDDDISNAVSDQLPANWEQLSTAKKPISYTVAIADKIDTLIGFFLIDEKPTSSKGSFELVGFSSTEKLDGDVYFISYSYGITYWFFGGRELFPIGW